MTLLGEDEGLPTVDGAVAGDDAVPEELLIFHTEIGAAVLHEPADLDEGAGIEEEINALAGRQLAAFVLLLDTSGASTLEGLFVHRIETREGVVRGRHGGRFYREFGALVPRDSGPISARRLRGPTSSNQLHRRRALAAPPES